MDNEKWVDISELFNEYQISNLGRIKSKERYKELVYKNGKVSRRLMREKIMKTFIDKDGYECIRIIDRKRGSKSFKVHRLVAMHFIPNPEMKKTVNHKNFIKNCNYFENLEWATNKEQIKHVLDNGRINGKYFDKIYSDELIIDTIKLFNKNNNGAKSCRETGLGYGCFSLVRKGSIRKELQGYFKNV